MKTILPALLFSAFVSLGLACSRQVQPDNTPSHYKKHKILSYFKPEKVVKMRVLLIDSVNPGFGDTVTFGVAMAVEHEGQRYSYMVYDKSLYYINNNDAAKMITLPRPYTKMTYRPFYWKDFDISVNGARLIDSNRFVIHNSPSQCLEGVASVTLTYKHKSGFTNTAKINLLSGKRFELNLSGRNGYWGNSGNSGTNGSDGSSERSCQSGTHGTHGTDGFRGSDGHDADIYLKQYKTADGQTEYLQAIVHDLTTGRRYYYFMDYSGSLRVIANGGDGGHGGRGGDGGNGGRQGDFRCTGGNGGDGGHGANAGNGGQIRIIADTSVSLSRLQLTTSNSGGRAGHGGRGGDAGAGTGTERANQRRNNAALPGRPGQNGQQGANGPRIETTVKPLDNSMFRPV
ncbi:MAG: hypothetical protein IM638_03975 [Bacteroidetes bacterium]|nr:hypothetical protein [Bacteroidota bacterium]